MSSIESPVPTKARERKSHDNVARFDFGKLFVREFTFFVLQLVGHAIGCTSFRFLADNVCCDTTWMRFRCTTEHRVPGVAHGACFGDTHCMDAPWDGGGCVVLLIWPLRVKKAKSCKRVDCL